MKVELETGWKPGCLPCAGSSAITPQKTWDGPEVSGSVLLESQEVHNAVRVWTQIWWA